MIDLDLSPPKHNQEIMSFEYPSVRVLAQFLHNEHSHRSIPCCWYLKNTRYFRWRTDILWMKIKYSRLRRIKRTVWPSGASTRRNSICLSLNRIQRILFFWWVLASMGSIFRSSITSISGPLLSIKNWETMLPPKIINTWENLSRMCFFVSWEACPPARLLKTSIFFPFAPPADNILPIQSNELNDEEALYGEPKVKSDTIHSPILHLSIFIWFVTIRDARRLHRYIGKARMGSCLLPIQALQPDRVFCEFSPRARTLGFLTHYTRYWV